jgi:Mnd1 family protein
MLPAVASINGMQVKEYVQGLLDDGKLRVEKIGSGNWYWCFGSEEKREKEKVKVQLEKEIGRMQKVTKDLEKELERIQEETAAAGADAAEEEETERKTLTTVKDELSIEVQRLKKDEDALLAAGAGGLEIKKEEIKLWKQDAYIWTDNISILEQYLNRLAGGDRNTVEAVLKDCYGDEYVEGEGLRELPLQMD